MTEHRTSTQNPRPAMMLLAACFVFFQVALVEANISFLSPYMKTKPYIAMRDVLNGGNGKSINYRPAPQDVVKDDGFVYAENLYDPQIVMNQLKGENSNVLNQQDQRIEMPEISSPLREALLSQQAYSMAMQDGVDNIRVIQTTSAPAFATKTQVQANKYNHNCFFSPMNCRMWKQPLPVVNDASEIELGVHGGLTQEGPRAVMVRRARPEKSPYQILPQPSFWRIFRGS